MNAQTAVLPAHSAMFHALPRSVQNFLDALYGTEERATRTMGFAYLTFAMGVVMSSNYIAPVCAM
jgi:hypothetical protein